MYFRQDNKTKQNDKNASYSKEKQGSPTSVSKWAGVGWVAVGRENPVSAGAGGGGGGATARGGAAGGVSVTGACAGAVLASSLAWLEVVLLHLLLSWGLEH